MFWSNVVSLFCPNQTIDYRQLRDAFARRIGETNGSPQARGLQFQPPRAVHVAAIKSDAVTSR
jgi:hypothetical protein